MARKITCITKSNGYHEMPHAAIEKLGWTEDSTQQTGSSTRIEMYYFIKGGGMAYVKDSYGDVAYLIANETASGTQYVKTQADSTKADNLLTLPECR